MKSHRASVIVCATASLLLSACGTPPSRDADVTVDATDARDAMPMDSMRDTNVPDVVDATPDVPAMDEGPLDAPTDVPTDEACGGSMCNGNCVDTRVGPQHCGGCANDCTALAHVTASITCAASACVLTGACATGFADCDSDASNGCETSLTDAANCGACGVACSGATPVCSSGSAGYACASACPVATEVRCDGTCIDPQSDLLHCGGCDTACPVPAHGVATCASATCGLTCNTGYHACDSDCADDTSPLTCGTSCTPCVPPAHATSTCTAGTCGFVCDPGYGRTNDMCSPIAPRPIAPMSTATATSRRPMFRWILATATTGAQVEVCRDRACTMIVATFTGVSSAAPSADLPSGVLFWRLRGMVVADVGVVPGPTWELNVGARSAAIDSSFGSTSDVDGDGYADVFVGAPSANSGTGTLYGFAGSAAGIGATANVTVTGPDGFSAYFGDSVASAGDVNGDGFVDLLVGARYASSVRGRAYVYLGSAAGLVRPASATITGPGTPGSEFGYAVSSAGDVNRDGYADVIVGAFQENSGAGAAYLYLGSATGIATTPAATLRGGAETNGAFGETVASAGDVNGDGFADVLVAASGEMYGTGRVYLYLGAASGLSTTPSAVLTGTDGTAGNFGEHLAGAGDVDGDGRSDIVVASPGASDGGHAYLFLGTSTGIATTPARVLTGTTNFNFATSLSGAGDVNGDGYADVLVGQLASVNGTDQVQLFFGGASGLPSVPSSVVLSPDGNGSYFGTVAAGAGDVDRDGFADVVVGEWRAAGRTFVFRGGASGLQGTASTTMNGPAFTSSEFGRAVCGASW